MKIIEIRKHLGTDSNGYCEYSLIAGDVAPPEVIANKETDYKKYKVDDCSLIHDQAKERYVIVPNEFLEEYIVEGAYVKDVPEDYNIENWYEVFGHPKKKKKKKNGKNKDITSEIFWDDSELERVDVKFIINDDDTEFAKALKLALNKRRLNVPKSKAGWLKAAFRKLKDGNLSMKEMERLIKILDMNYTVKFFSEI